MHIALHPDSIPEDWKYNFEEMCPHCDTFIPIVIDDNEFSNYEVTCPVCGKPMMLCTLCHWDMADAGKPDYCNWTKEHGCFRKEHHHV